MKDFLSDIHILLVTDLFLIAFGILTTNRCLRSKNKIYAGSLYVMRRVISLELGDEALYASAL